LRSFCALQNQFGRRMETSVSMGSHTSRWGRRASRSRFPSRHRILIRRSRRIGENPSSLPTQRMVAKALKIMAWGAVLEDVAHGKHQRTIKPDFHQLAVARHEFRELSAIEGVVSLCFSAVWQRPPVPAPNLSSREKINTQLQPAPRQERERSAITSPFRFARECCESVVGGLGLPHAESTHMLGDKQMYFAPRPVAQSAHSSVSNWAGLMRRAAWKGHRIPGPARCWARSARTFDFEILQAFARVGTASLISGAEAASLNSGPEA